MSPSDLSRQLYDLVDDGAVVAAVAEVEDPSISCQSFLYASVLADGSGKQIGVCQAPLPPSQP